MIDNLIKDYKESELEYFINKYPESYNILCIYIGRYILDKRNLTVGIVLPYNKDYGCITASVINNDIVEVVDVKYF